MKAIDILPAALFLASSAMAPQLEAGLDRLVAPAHSPVKTIVTAHANGEHENAGEHDHGGKATMDVPAPGAPALTLEVDDRPSGGFALRLTTANFRFAREHEGGGHVPGEGHALLHVNGKEIKRIFGTHDEIAPLPPGVHEIEVGLFTNDHLAYAVDGRPVAERVVVRVLGADRRPPDTGDLVRIDVRVRDGKADVEGRTVRVTEGDTVELRWSTDERHEIHLHGYDIETEVTPDSPVVMHFYAVLTGRFPAETHGHGGHGHEVLLYLEVYPR